jgi:hypothetical protein
MGNDIRKFFVSSVLAIAVCCNLCACDVAETPPDQGAVISDAGAAQAPGLPGTPGGLQAPGAIASPGGGASSGIGAGTGVGTVVPPSGLSSPDAGSLATSWCQAKSVFDKNCVVCHDGKGSFASPMGLIAHQDFLAQAPLSAGKKVFEAVAARIHDNAKPMPPRGVLSTGELQILDSWIAAGAPGAEGVACSSAPQEGGTSNEPTTGPWPPPEGCDAIYKITSHGPAGAGTPFEVQPREETHPPVTWDAPWGTERVQAIAFRPITDNPKVLHHWILYANNGVGAFLTGWAPGDDERQPMPKDVGMEMPTGAASLRLDMHYNSLTASSVEYDQSGVEVCIVKGQNLRKNPAAVTMSLAVFGFPLAPANTLNYEATSACSVTASQPVHLMTASPHAHKYAVSTRFTVKKKDGREIVMLDHPFVFGEQGSYRLDPEVIVETGDTIYTTCVYSNTTNQDVNFGMNTADEMCFNFASYYPSGALSCGLGGLLDGLFGP